MENKIKNSKVEDEELEEEMMMEKFYSTLRNFRDARDRRRKQLDELEKNDKKKRKMKIAKQETTKTSSSWVPSFEREDFTTELELPFIFPTPCDRTGVSKKETHKDVSLDLKLAL
ncbi:hypothetical protein L6164_010334 [Bauhinia variegata]|uniref:Uncharacterized protein n=1 Tax=Bauhinia variegata TaxID=167791 RepID=A0ACB9PMX4_BAUVA|nr:hypothetical protein L6164_010334 [Bauhinia variegata]